MSRQQSVGDGRNCITHSMHGASMKLRNGVEWCANQEHDGKRAREGRPAVPQTPAFLHKQEAEQKASA